MSVYEQYRASRTSWGIGAMGSVIVEVELDDNAKTTGVGISIGGEAACFMIENHLSRFVEGQNPSNVELVRDMIFMVYEFCYNSYYSQLLIGLSIDTCAGSDLGSNVAFYHELW